MGTRRFTVQEWQSLALAAEYNTVRLAELCSVSPRQLERIFRETFGKPPRRWLRELQCSLAKDLMLEGCANKEAARNLKFATEAHFCREFKKFYGVSPQGFSKKFSSAAECRI